MLCIFEGPLLDLRWISCVSTLKVLGIYKQNKSRYHMEVTGLVGFS